MKIAYVTPYSSSDIHAWSGSVYFIREALAKAGCEIIPIDSLKDSGRLPAKLKEKAIKHLLGKTYLSDRRPGLLDAYARQVSERCEAVAPDIIFSPGTIPIANLRTKTPVVFWTDATFAGIHNYYGLFSNLHDQTVRDGHHVDKHALRNASLAIYTSDWAAQTATDHYGANADKVKVVPYGANITDSPNEVEIELRIADRDEDVCNLLFIGVDWERKGGPIALETAQILNDRGVKTHLHIMGVQPPGEMPDFVTLHGFISKKAAEGVTQFDRLLSDAHFLIVPSRAECFGLVFAEASSLGVPSLAASTGGIPSVVTPGVNGQLFPLDAGGDDYADFITNTMKKPGAYQALARSSFQEFRSRLNWDSAGAEVARLMQGLL